MTPSLCFVRLWSPPPYDRVWGIWRNDVFIGYAVRQGHHWLAAEPSGRFIVAEDGAARSYQRRKDVAPVLAMVAEGVAP